MVDHGDLVGVVSLRDLLAVAQIRPADEAGADVPRGLEGVVVAETSVGDVRGQQGFYHYRQYSAVDLAATRSFEDVWHLLFDGALPDRTAVGRPSPPRWPASATLPPGLAGLLPALASHRLAARRPAHRRLPPRGRAGLAPGPGHRPPTSGEPRPCGSARSSPPSSPPSTGCVTA